MSNNLIDWKELNRSTWNHFNDEFKYKWSLKKHQRTELLRIITQSEYDHIFMSNEDIAINRRLRPILSKYLSGEDREKADTTALWIIATWGGIKKGKEKIPAWSSELGDYNEYKVRNFIEKNDTRKVSCRISSWSKLLAFHDEKKHAIYDARTSISLNCALALNDKPYRFYTPTGRSSKYSIITASCIFRRNHKQSLLGYTDYLNMLSALVDAGIEKSIFEAEMKLFSATEDIARKYITAIATKQS